jgi:MYXO-CTERM domain-containing protein
MSGDDMLRIAELLLAALLAGVLFLRRRNRKKALPKDL